MHTPLQSPVGPPPLVIRLVMVVSAILTVVTFAALVLTVVTLSQAGPAAFAEFGVDALVATWPTALALLFVIIGPKVAARLRTPPAYVGLSLLGVWLLSLLLYLGRDASGRSSRGILAALVWTLTPVLFVFTLRTILLRRSLRPSTQLAVLAAVGAVLWWLTAPMAIAVTCAVASSCP